jgi:hypothetical protein
MWNRGIKMLKLWIAAVGFSGILFVAATAQETNTKLVTPRTASVSSSKHLQLVPGDKPIFWLILDEPPSGYEGRGKIIYSFQNVGSTSPHITPWGVEDTSAGGSTDLKDGQVKYDLPLTITDQMSPGTWKLTEVTIRGPNSQNQISIPDNITFEIPQIPPVIVHIHTSAPDRVKAGQRFTFKITMDEYPKGMPQGCGLTLSGILHSTQPIVQPNPRIYKIYVNDIDLKPDQHSYEMSGSFDFDLPGSPWQAEISINAALDPPPVSPRDYETRIPHCFHSAPQLEGVVRFPFTLVAADIKTPTSATVIVNPSQIELLRYEAGRLKAKVEHLRQQLSSENIAANHVILRKSVQDAMTDLDRTEAAYKEKGDKDAPPSYEKAVNTFFGDIRLTYREALKSLTDNSALLRQTGPRMVLVSSVVGGSSLHLDPASMKALDSLLRVPNAYYTVASTKSMTFNLRLISHPDGAAISYKRLGDPSYETYPNATDSKIENLPRAVWYFLLQKTGYADWDGHYDGTRESEDILDVHLTPK